MRRFVSLRSLNDPGDGLHTLRRFVSLRSLNDRRTDCTA